MFTVSWVEIDNYFLILGIFVDIQTNLLGDYF